MAASEAYVPRTIQAWRTLLNWLAFLFRILAQILRGTPSFDHVLCCVGLRRGSFLSTEPHETPQFKPLPVVELVEEREEVPPCAAVPFINGGGRVLVAPPLEKLTVLDLDESLVCAYETSSLPAMLLSKATEAGLNWFEFECISSHKEYEGEPKINHVTVFERPGLKEFLNQLSEFCMLVLFTAGLEGYARPLVDIIDVENQISRGFIGLRQLVRKSAAVLWEYREHVKDLSCLSKDLCRIVIVDNNPFSFLRQPSNGIPCRPFSAEQPQDDQLLEVILPLLKHLSLQKDVRPLLNEKFHMPEWFRKHGIPVSGWRNTGYSP